MPMMHLSGTLQRLLSLILGAIIVKSYFSHYEMRKLKIRAKYYKASKSQCRVKHFCSEVYSLPITPTNTSIEINF